jgi:ketosteroid isomerase-like protein
MLHRFLALLLLSSVGAGAVAAQPSPPSKCATAEHRRLDFWVGDWDAYEVGGSDQSIARARVDVILDGCALREVYEQTDGLVGQSFTTWDASRKVWHQTWVTNGGALLQIDGRFQGDSLTLQGPRLSAAGKKEIVRGVWRRLPQDGGVREIAHTSADGGATWRPWFDVLFRPHKEGPAADKPSEGDTATATLTQLNQEYVDAFMKADVRWYREHLADDFVCIDSSGSVLNREAFLADTAGGPGVKSYALKEVQIRTYGPVALVQARGEYTRPDGTTGTSRYTDVWALQDGKWKTVSAQITRIQAPPK